MKNGKKFDRTSEKRKIEILFYHIQCDNILLFTQDFLVFLPPGENLFLLYEGKETVRLSDDNYPILLWREFSRQMLTQSTYQPIGLHLKNIVLKIDSKTFDTTNIGEIEDGFLCC